MYKILLPLLFLTVKIQYFQNLLALCVVYLEDELCAKHKDLVRLHLFWVIPLSNFITDV